MRRYTVVSGVLLALVACVQLLRVLLQWPVVVATFSVPLWASVVAAVAAGALATWAFRLASGKGAEGEIHNRNG